MDDARCIELNKIVTNEDLYVLENVKSYQFVCDECGVSLIPCSYKKSVNLRKPYFKTGKNAEHKAGCYAKATAKIREQAKTSRISTEEGFPLAYPNRFNLAAVKSAKFIHEELINEEPSDSKRIGAQNISSAANAGHTKTKQNYVTSSFQTLVDQYFNFPFDRDRELTFEGIKGNQYQQIFQKINNPIGKQKFRFQTAEPETKIFFSILSWDKPEIDNNIIKIKLSAGWWQQSAGKKKNLRPYFVEINTEGWQASVLTKFTERLAQIRELVKGTDKKALMAFVGEQDREEDFYRFTCDESRLMCFKVF
ncbi:hypothetical protein L2735_02075 [Shewanella olleyana]|uniref:hypothetical protein n=1 Tax=Shewanella olleyana TaxID=135626 RepID=UPI00200C937C|nr:hypothetical protein [Shewanella olleyana]MCL1065597.1 hypothetical protein [Shewanella olleyana]